MFEGVYRQCVKYKSTPAGRRCAKYAPKGSVSGFGDFAGRVAVCVKAPAGYMVKDRATGQMRPAKKVCYPRQYIGTITRSLGLRPTGKVCTKFKEIKIEKGKHKGEVVRRCAEWQTLKPEKLSTAKLMSRYSQAAAKKGAKLLSSPKRSSGLEGYPFGVYTIEKDGKEIARGQLVLAEPRKGRKVKVASRRREYYLEVPPRRMKYPEKKYAKGKPGAESWKIALEEAAQSCAGKKGKAFRTCVSEGIRTLVRTVGRPKKEK
jgi:hypothetical protein